MCQQSSYCDEQDDPLKTFQAMIGIIGTMVGIIASLATLATASTSNSNGNRTHNITTGANSVVGNGNTVNNNVNNVAVSDSVEGTYEDSASEFKAETWSDIDQGETPLESDLRETIAPQDVGQEVIITLVSGK